MPRARWGSASPVSLEARGVQGCPPRVEWAGLLPACPEHLSRKSQALEQTVVKPCWFAEPVPTLQPPNHGAQLLERCGGSGCPPAPRPGARGLCRRRRRRRKSRRGKAAASCSAAMGAQEVREQMLGCKESVSAQRRLHPVLPLLTSPTGLGRNSHSFLTEPLKRTR